MMLRGGIHEIIASYRAAASTRRNQSGLIQPKKFSWNVGY